MPVFDQTHQKSLHQLLAFLNLHQHAKNNFIPSIHSWDKANFKVHWPDWPQLFNLSKFVLTWKKSGCFIDLLWRYGWQKNNAIWFAENILAHISGRNICQIWDFCWNIANNISFHYRTNLVKINGLMVKPFILQRSIKWIPRISGNLVVKVNCLIEVAPAFPVEPHP